MKIKTCPWLQVRQGSFNVHWVSRSEVLRAEPLRNFNRFILFNLFPWVEVVLKACWWCHNRDFLRYQIHSNNHSNGWAVNVSHVEKLPPGLLTLMDQQILVTAPHERSSDVKPSLWSLEFAIHVNFVIGSIKIVYNTSAQW